MIKGDALQVQGGARPFQVNVGYLDVAVVHPTVRCLH